MKEKQTCVNIHPLVSWTYKGNKQEQAKCPVCHKVTKDYKKEKETKIIMEEI